MSLLITRTDCRCDSTRMQPIRQTGSLSLPHRMALWLWCSEAADR